MPHPPSAPSYQIYTTSQILCQRKNSPKNHEKRMFSLKNRLFRHLWGIQCSQTPKKDLNVPIGAAMAKHYSAGPKIDERTLTDVLLNDNIDKDYRPRYVYDNVGGVGAAVLAYSYKPIREL